MLIPGSKSELYPRLAHSDKLPTIIVESCALVDKRIENWHKKRCSIEIQQYLPPLVRSSFSFVTLIDENIQDEIKLLNINQINIFEAKLSYFGNANL